MCIRQDRDWSRAAAAFDRIIMQDSSRTAERINEQSEGGRCLAAAWIIEVISRPRRAPLVEHPHEAAALKVRLRHVLGYIGKAETIHGGFENFVGAIQDDLPVHAHLQLATIALEIPGPQSAFGGKALVDASVIS